MQKQSEKTTGASLAQYSLAAQKASAEIIRAYSTSFGWSSNLLGRKVRVHIRNIYALVRVADEIVDGAAAEALGGALGVDPHYLLDQLERETYRAMDVGFSANVVVHSFAQTSRLVGIDREIVRPFFNSMRMDLTKRIYDLRSFDTYVYGSAEVVGLMCLRAFIFDRNKSEVEIQKLVTGARALGAAFQKINFLRDLGADFEKLGRSYFPSVKVDEFTDAERDELIA
ncbi:MAG: phytoene/squalene synthase family protein, partial [Micrococcales bacterium]